MQVEREINGQQDQLDLKNRTRLNIERRSCVFKKKLEQLRKDQG